MGNIFYDGYEEFTKEINFDFSKHSSIGVGGVAKIAFFPKNQVQLIRLLTRLKENEIGYILIGNMTNVLPSDTPSNKVIISTKKMSKSAAENKIFFETGVLSATILRICRHAQKSGAEFLSGIPCTLGGALYMNAGVNGRCIAEIVEEVFVYRDGKIDVLKAQECEFSYKNSLFMHTNDVVLGATLRLVDSDIEKIRNQETIYLKRRAHLPRGKSMGCVFKNVLINGERVSAGKWIEKAGLKGARHGGACVAKEHANFIINDKKATAEDVKTLIAHIKREVYRQYQVVLEEEIQYLD